MRIVFVQSQNTENGDVAIENIREMACRHALPGDLWLLPEVFDTGWNLRPGERIDGSQNIVFLRQMSQEFRISIAGSFYLASEGCIHNRFYVVTADGSEYYCDKRHLFGDFELMNVAPGDSLLTFPLNGIMFRVVVCYDLRFPVWCRNNGGDYDALICISQWPSSRQQDRSLLLAARALENVSYVLNCNGLGASMVYSPDGRIDFLMPQGSDVAFYELDIERLRKYRAGHPHLRNMDKFEIKM
ncbi:MAG: hypothetical protein II852_15160 [Bacteroidales bacterium]|nr:hypothetical protein [Bacteroidales bacterium]